MTAEALTREPIGVGLDPLRDLSHREARAARDLADWLAGLELVPMATRTLDAYEKYGARLLRGPSPNRACADWSEAGSSG